MTTLGVSSRIVPSLCGIPARHLTALWRPFKLLNVGCALCVGLQIASDWHPAPFALNAASGVMALAALSWWGEHLVMVSARGLVRGIARRRGVRLT